MATLICAKCKKEINPENLVECPHCWEIYHQECWEDISNCVTCKKFNPIFEIAQAQKEAEKEEQEKETSLKNEVEEYEEEQPEMQMTAVSPIANAMLLVSKVMLVLCVVLGIAVAVAFMTGGVEKGIIGIVIGVAIAVLGWALSVLINGFGELINNSQKTTYYLSKLVEKNEEQGENQWEN